MSTSEGQIATHETKINQHTENINGLTTDVNGLQASKQDKLTAGKGITIVNSVISAKRSIYQGSLIDLFEKTSSYIRVKQDFEIEYINISGNGLSRIYSTQKICKQDFLANRTMYYFASVKSDYGSGYILYRNDTNKISIYVSGQQLTEETLDTYQIKTDSGNVDLTYTKYFRIWT